MIKKTILYSLISVLCCQLSLFASDFHLKEIQVSGIKSIDNMAKFELTTVNDNNPYIVLDCQSFLHHISWSRSHELPPYQAFFLYSPECWDIVEFLYASQHSELLSCAEFDFKNNTYRLYTCDPTQN